MPQRDTSGIGERIPRELIDADFNIAFSLVEMAKEESRNNRQLSSDLLRKAGEMLDSIRDRLLRMTASQKEVFETRCAELDAAIERAKVSDSGIAPE